MEGDAEAARSCVGMDFAGTAAGARAAAPVCASSSIVHAALHLFTLRTDDFRPIGIPMSRLVCNTNTTR